MTALQTLLDDFRSSAKTEREKGAYFEELIVRYLTTEPAYRDQYSDVWPYADWIRGEGVAYGRDASDEGIDLVAKTRGTEEYHAIQCKFYDPGHTIAKPDIDSFFTASGQHPFKHRLIVATTDKWNEKADKADKALKDQQPPVTKITLRAAHFSDSEPPVNNPRIVVHP